MISVFLVEAWADRMTRRELKLPGDATLADAFAAAGLDPKACSVGVWGKLMPLDAALNDGDRLEQYRGLIADPKQARHQRANDQGYRWQGRTRRAARTP